MHGALDTDVLRATGLWEPVWHAGWGPLVPSPPNNALVLAGIVALAAAALVTRPRTTRSRP
ncbi:hypothetical protein [Actinoplanes sp. RD1]|uniref:hypothetical protein n=1 Tax=Actinoplanes sp. RD1 TaxID=3064538 RepID=UPI002741FF98|nr:hypothetical protein [Actinoplanes sp. RD1]